MIIGKIDYLNLLPFYIFLKSYRKYHIFKTQIEYKRSFPSKINREFRLKRVDGAFISSIASRGSKCTDVGIVANREVLSVMVFKSNSKSYDIESETSNALSKVLNISGEVSIGDKALKRYLANEQGMDLAKEWHSRYGLPFVFARFCYSSNPKFFKKLSRDFLKSRVKIPQYILSRYSKERGVARADILFYLTKISYKISYRERLALKLFFKKLKELNL